MKSSKGIRAEDRELVAHLASRLYTHAALRSDNIEVAVSRAVNVLGEIDQRIMLGTGQLVEFRCVKCGECVRCAGEAVIVGRGWVVQQGAWRCRTCIYLLEGK